MTVIKSTHEALDTKMYLKLLAFIMKSLIVNK